MSTPMTPDQFLAQLAKWKVPYREHAGWRTHNRDSAGPWGPVHGILLHHTGDDAPDDADERVLWAGRSDLPGPLCHWAMCDDGTIVLIGWGRTNHAGLGAGNVRDALLTEAYGDYPPRPAADSVDGNQIMYGQETTYSGAQPPTSAAYAATVRVFAAVCDWHGWSARSCIGHKEWTSRKVDPGHVDMALFRADVQAALDAGPEGDDMSQQDVDTILAGVRTLIAGAGTSYTKDTEPDPSLRDANLAEIGIVGARHAYAAEGLARAAVGRLDQLTAAVVALAGARPDVDEAALARDLAPMLAQYLPDHLEHFSDAELARMATACADENARRQAS